MNKWRSASFLLILAVGSSIAESVDNAESEYSTLPESVRSQPETKSEKDALDYETALKPAVLQKRSIANIARLLLGGNVPPNHPLVKYQEPKAFNLANNIVASFPGAGLQGSESIISEGWARPNSALSNIQQLFETKSKIIPYTGQVATGLTGLASVKGDLLRQIHSISTQAIAQAAAEAAARALASAAAAHAVTNSIAHSVSPGAQTGIKGGWSSFQNTFVAQPGKTPGEQPGPPYQESAHINHYQPPPHAYNPYAVPSTTPAPALPSYPSPVGYSPQPQPPQNYQNNGYYTLYNTQPNTAQTPYTPAPPVAHARPTLSPNTLIATTPSGYSPSLSKPLLPEIRKGNTLPVIIYTPGSNNTPLTSFRRAVPADIFGRNAAQPSSTSSLLSTISSLLSASTAAYNAAVAGNQQPGTYQQQPSTLFSTILSAGSSPLPSNNPSVLRPTSPAAAAVSSILSSSLGSSAANHGYQRQQFSTLPQGGGHYGSHPSSSGSAYLHVPANPAGSASGYPSETRSSSVHSPSYSFNQYVPGHHGESHAQPGANPYASNAGQPSPQFGNRVDGAPVTAGIGHGGVSNFPTNGFQHSHGSGGSGYPGYNGPARLSNGHVSGWNTQHAGSSPSASTWPAGSVSVYPPGYTGQTPGNVNHSPGSYGGPATQYQTSAGSSFVQQTYPAPPANAYQSPTPNAYAQPQSSPYQPSQFNNPNSYQPANGNPNSIDRVRNSDITHRYDTQDLSQSASNMGHGYDEDDQYDDKTHHSNQQAQRRHRVPNNSYSSSSRYPSPSKKRPSKRPTYSDSKTGQKKSPGNSYHHHHQHHDRVKNPGSYNGQKNVEEKGKRVIPTGSKKGSDFDSAVDVVDASIDEYYYEGDRYSSSDEKRNDNTDKNRWRTKNPSGQRTNSLHDLRSNGRWTGKKTHTKQAPSKNVRGHGGESEGLRPESRRPSGSSRKNHGNKKVKTDFQRSQEKSRERNEREKSRTEAAELYRGRVRAEQQQQSTTHKSRDVYTTLPEYVFKVGERPDVFVRPGGKRKHRVPLRGRANPRVGEADGSSSSDIGDITKEEVLHTSSSNHPYDETFSKGSDAEASLEERTDSPSSLSHTASTRSENEESLSTSEEADETSRADSLTDQSSHSGFITSEEFDPEEREAFVDDVYADEHSEHSKRYDDEGISSAETVNGEIEEDPSEEK